MTEKEYRAHPAVNKSTLWELRRSPAHYRHLLTVPREDTPALQFGRAVHKIVLQPEDFETEFVCAPKIIDRRTKAGRDAWSDFISQVGDRTIITSDDYINAVAMRNVVQATPAAKRLLGITVPEVPLFWTDDITGVACKCRCDLIGNGIIVDYKTCTDASTDAFTREALRYGYDLQAAMYCSGAIANGYGPAVEWFFIAQEKTPPYAVNVIRAGDTFLERGYWRLNELLAKYAECSYNDSWPGYNATVEPNEIILPEWALIPED